MIREQQENHEVEEYQTYGFLLEKGLRVIYVLGEAGHKSPPILTTIAKIQMCWDDRLGIMRPFFTMADGAVMGGAGSTITPFTISDVVSRLRGMTSMIGIDEMREAIDILSNEV